MRALFLTLAVACWMVSSSVLFAVAAGDTPSAKVEGTFVIPGGLPSFEGRRVDIRLYRYDPRIAGKAAELIDQVQIEGLAHTQGRETRNEFTIGADCTLERNMGYYLTLFVLRGDERTHIGECEHSPKGLCKVLTTGQPDKVCLRVREVKK